MLVLVTGATGFLGAHVVHELVEGGHVVRVMARRPARVVAALAPFGVQDRVEVAVADMVDPDAVRAAVAGCGAVVHAAAQIDPSGAEAAAAANLAGVRNVIGAGLEVGADPIVYASSTTAYAPGPDGVLVPDSPLAEPRSVYGASKRRAEELVRAWQAEGAPITTIVLGGLYGPVSPHREASFVAIRSAIEQAMVVPPGGVNVLDVRDAARLFARAVASGQGPRVLLAAGRYVTWDAWVDLLGEAVGHEVARIPMTGEELVELGRSLEASGGDGAVALTEETARLMMVGAPSDDSATLRAFDIAYRPLAATFADTVAYLRRCGDLP